MPYAAFFRIAFAVPITVKCSAGVFTRTAPGAGSWWKEIHDKYAADIDTRDRGQVIISHLLGCNLLVIFTICEANAPLCHIRDMACPQPFNNDCKCLLCSILMPTV